MHLNERSLIGQEVAGYYIEDVIGKGGMAVVYLALDPRLSRRVALKILNPALSVDERFRQRFILESRTVASIEHPNIIPIYEANSDDDGVLFIAMRYVDGLDLRRFFYDRGPLPLGQVNQIFAQVAAALDTAHAHDLIHRDVKPANILMAGDHVYLTDFGITKHRTSISGLTQTDQFIGTPKYMAPEQINKEHIDGRCDQYALACVVYEALTGRLPFQRDNDIALLWAHLAEAPVPVSALRPDLPLEVDGVMMRALAKSPEQRYESCGVFVAALRDAISGPSAETQPRPQVGVPATSAKPARGTKLPLVLAGVVAAVAAITLVVLLVLGNTGDGGWARYPGTGAAPVAFDYPSGWTATTHGDLFALASPKAPEFESLFVAGVGADWARVNPLIQSDPETATGMYVQLTETIDPLSTAAQLKAALDGMMPGRVEIAKEPLPDRVGDRDARKFEGTITDTRTGGRLSFTGYVVPRAGKPVLMLYFCASNGCEGQTLSRLVGRATMS
ncbi:serine/threonine-protein kinase [Nonomuraea sp. NPDC046570]|uniref:serine/threonine protein kinase n=1 Tax=Nonomuraea sp. NPDC046570 TaxID=3155255 RepID=UPI0033FFC91B